MKKYLISAAALILMCGAVSANALLLTTGAGGGQFVPVLEDEFVGPFASWINVKTSCGAMGNGVADDTAAIQTCLNSLSAAHAGTLYFPPGTYMISSTLTNPSDLFWIQIIGADPATTKIKWAGTAGGTMWLTDGFEWNREARITWDGSGTAGTIEWQKQNTLAGTVNTFNDEVFENAAIGWRIGNGAANNDDTVAILRCTFKNLTTAGVSLESSNSIQIDISYSTFQSNGAGITNAQPSTGAGVYVARRNIFLSNTTDIVDLNGDFLDVQGNYSSGSGQFYNHAGLGQNTNMNLFHANTILNPTNTVSITALNPQQMFLVDNIICSTNGSQTTPSVTLDTSGNGAVGGNIGSLGNTFTTTSEPTVAGTSTVIWTQQDTTGVACPATTQPSYPSPPNMGRHIFDIAAGATAATIQAAITSAVAYQGSHPVVHLSSGAYSIASTLTIPANLDVQIVGDGFGTQLTWTGTAGAAMWSLTAPSKALLQDFYTTGNSSIALHTSDVVGARIQAREFLPFADTDNTSTGMTITGLTNTTVNFDDYGGLNSIEAIITGTGSAVPSTVSFFCPALDGFASNGTFQVTSNANLLVESFWDENSGQVGTGGTMGTFSGNAGTISFIAGTYLDKSNNTSPAAVTLAGYIGQFLWMTGHFQNASPSWDGSGPITVTSPTSSTNALFMGDYFGQTGNGFSFWNVAAGGNVYGKNNQTLVSGTGSLPTADTGGTPSAGAMTNFLAQMRAHLPVQNFSLPPGVDDIRIDRVNTIGAHTALTIVTP